MYSFIAHIMLKAKFIPVGGIWHFLEAETAYSAVYVFQSSVKYSVHYGDLNSTRYFMDIAERKYISLYTARTSFG